MNQLYAEAGVKRKDTPKTMGLRVLMVIGVLAGIFAMTFGGFFSFIGIAAAAIIIYFFPRLSIEYEYIFVDGQIDFDRIAGKAKRKTMLRIDMEQVEIIAPKGSHSLDAYTHVQCEKKDFSSGDKNAKPYIIIVNKENKKYQIVFEPNETMLSMIKQKSPRKLAQY